MTAQECLIRRAIAKRLSLPSRRIDDNNERVFQIYEILLETNAVATLAALAEEVSQWDTHDDETAPPDDSHPPAIPATKGLS